MEAGSGGMHAGDCQASPGAAAGELGLGKGRQQLLSVLNISKKNFMLVLSRHNFAC